MKTKLFTIIISGWLWIGIAFPVSAQYDFPAPTVTVSTLPRGGVRVILPEEEVNQPPQNIAAVRSQKSVLFGLGAVLLVIVAIVAAMSLHAHSERKPDDHD